MGCNVTMCKTQSVPYQVMETHNDTIDYVITEKYSSFMLKNNIPTAISTITVKNVDTVTAPVKIEHRFSTEKHDVQLYTDDVDILPGESYVSKKEMTISLQEKFTVNVTVTSPMVQVSKMVTRYRQERKC
jgi:hypothetical protein